jgi:acetyl-CoA synthetase
MSVRPNLLDYEVEAARFTWKGARSLLDGLPEGRGLNIAHEAVDRHAAGARADHLAIRWLGKSGEVRDFTYRDLARLSSRFANALASLELDRGTRVFALAGRVPELYVSALGTLKAGSVFAPMFSAFGPEPIRERMTIGEAAVLVTTPDLYRKKVAPIRDRLSGLEHVILIGSDGDEGIPGAVSWDRAIGNADEDFEIPATDPEDVALLHFTSGTTGRPKGAIHVHGAVVAHHVTGVHALDFHPDDIFWCTADPGWVTGTSYGIISPLTNGITAIVDEGEFDARRWYSIIEEQRVTVWYTAPTAVRMLMRAGIDIVDDYDLGSLRFIASVGEPLNPQGVIWGKEAYGLPIHDNWWQTETGGIMIANYAAMPIKPGSMGKPLPGIDATILERGEEGELVLMNGEPVEIDHPEREGELALRPGWPSMFRGYLHDDERYAKCFVGGWYRTGDLVRRDADGYYFFVGRGDDVIKSAGHLIGPFEVETTLMRHPAVQQAGVIGKPDPIAGEIVKAFVVLHSGYEPSDELRLELRGFARTHLGAAVAPKEIDFANELPFTRSGKVMRRILKAKELGQPLGDLSTLESPS